MLSLFFSNFKIEEANFSTKSKVFMTVNLAKNRPVYYPSSDGKPMAENTIQYDWLTTIKSGFEEITQNQTVFVAGDLLWYPEEGNNRIRIAPDVMAAVGRPKGDRSSYLQWNEDNIPFQVVVEILSPGNRKKEMAHKLAFYEKYGVEEYIIYYPQKNNLQIYQRINNKLVELHPIPQRWTSQYLGFHLELQAESLAILHPNGQPFKNHLEVVAEKEKAIAEKQEAIAEKQEAIAEKEILAQKLRELGIDPNDLLAKK